MKDEFWFKVEGKPIQQGSMKAFNNRVVHTKSVELNAWRREVAKHALLVGCRPRLGEVHITIKFSYKRPRTVTRATPTVPPDLDKQVRSILDALTGVAYADDSQVTLILASKVYAQVGGVEVGVKYVSGNT